MMAACLLLSCLGSNLYTDSFEQGNAAYIDGTLPKAIQAYERLVASGVENAALYYNLANAFYEGGDVGRAVLNYERAIGLDPSFGAARQSLAYVVGKSKHKMARPDGFALTGLGKSRLPGVPQRYFRWALAGLWCALWGILAAGQRKARQASLKTRITVSVLLMLCAAAWVFPVPQSRAAVVTTSSAAMRYGPDTQDAVRDSLAAGDRVLADESRGAWVRVETASGVRGWVERDAITFVGPPFTVDSTDKEPSSL